MITPLRLAVVDDHPLFREGVARSLVEHGGFEIVAEGASAEDALRIVGEVGPEILLLDISLPGGGLNAAQEILVRRPGQKIVMLTVSEARDDVTTALNHGVRGYVLKGVGSRMLAEILRSVAAGEIYVSPVVSARLISDLQAIQLAEPRADPLRQLTDREAGILELVSAGLSNKEVAGRLALQEKTVKHHMTRVLAKLNVRNRTEAAMLLRDARSRAAEAQ